MEIDFFFFFLNFKKVSTFLYFVKHLSIPFLSIFFFSDCFNFNLSFRVLLTF